MISYYKSIYCYWAFHVICAKSPSRKFFFEMTKFPKTEPINFCKFYDNEGDTQLLLQSDHFINSTVWYLIFGQNFITSILVLSFYKCMVMSVPCDIGKRYDTSFKMKFFDYGVNILPWGKKIEIVEIKLIKW